MEELQVIQTKSGRQFKPWATKDDLTNPASVTAIASEIASGKQAIAEAINAKGGSASETDTFSKLAEAVDTIPNFSDMVKLAGIIAGGNYDKNTLQGHNENVKYGKTEIIDNVGAFEKINVGYCFQNWDLLQEVNLPALTSIRGIAPFQYCSALQEVNLPALTSISGGSTFHSCSALQEVNLPNLTTISGGSTFNGCSALQEIIFVTLIRCDEPFYDKNTNLRNITIGQDTDINLPFQNWTATNVIAEGQRGIDELNTNLYNNLLTKLYDHSSDGETRTLRIGWLAKVSAENIAYANAKGWTLTT